MDISNGPGVRVSFFFQGCHFHCKNCFNSETWDFNKGKEFTDDTIETVLGLCGKDYITGLSILGGEPMHPVNIDGTIKLAMEFKKRFPDKTLWVWTGFKFEDIIKKEVLNYIDVLIDGQFVDELYSPKLKWRGSENQRVIDVKETLANNEIVLYEK